MTNYTMTTTGIWIDQQQALIISYDNEKELKQTITSNVEDFHVKGGSRSKTPWGPQDNVSDKKYLERKKQQLKKFFHKISNQIQNSDAIAIYGPAETKTYFKEELKSNFKSTYEKVRIIKVQDSMTENQFKALVKSFSKSINKK